ncbi:MAG: hypothetical protein GY898_22345 [Proteobacteria bacterium]|nr:hypothetical protein [Pseudomonadota bacterium]
MSWNTRLILIEGDCRESLPAWADEAGLRLDEPWQDDDDAAPLDDAPPGIHGDCTVIHDVMHATSVKPDSLRLLTAIAARRVVALTCAGNAGLWSFRVLDGEVEREVRVRNRLVTQAGTPVAEEEGWSLPDVGDHELIGWALALGFDPERFDADDVWSVAEVD